MDATKVDRAVELVHELRLIADEEGSLDEKFGRQGLGIALGALESLLEQVQGEQEEE